MARHPGEEEEPVLDPAAQLSRMRENAQAMPPRQSPASTAPKIGRNDLCPCGSGKKFKKCHGVDEEEDQPTV